VLHEDAGFLERARIEEELDALARGEAPLGVELRDPLLAAAGQDGLLAASQLFDRRGSCQERSSCWGTVLGQVVESYWKPRPGAIGGSEWELTLGCRVGAE